MLCYLDDFLIRHPDGISAAAAREQYDSVLRVLADLGIAEKASKRDYPSTRSVILGFEVDTDEQTVGLTEERCRRYVGEIDTFLSNEGDWSRRDLASIIGRLQWCAPVVAGGQLHLREAYRARDAFVDGQLRAAGPREAWSRGVRVHRTALAVDDLRWWQTALRELVGRPVYLTNVGVANGFWRGDIDEGDAALDAAAGQCAEPGVQVITTDASGYAGGAWWMERRAAWRFEAAFAAPNCSSNYRELATAVLALEEWGPHLRGQRVLIRTDNTTTMSVLNRGDSAHDTLLPLARRAEAAAKKYGFYVAARHVPGLKNGLADGLSRWRHDDRDEGDWMFDHGEFTRVQTALAETLASPRDFSLDGCADPVGANSHCPRFRSAVDSILDHDLGGEHLWCNADWRLLAPTIKHFKECAARRPFDTSGLFVVPVKTHASWWRELKGFEILDVYRAGSDLFTRRQSSESGQISDSGLRESCRPAKWPVVLAWWPPAHREPRAGSGAVRVPAQAVPGGALGLRRLRLSGDGSSDAALLHRLPQSSLRTVRRPDRRDAAPDARVRPLPGGAVRVGWGAPADVGRGGAYTADTPARSGSRPHARHEPDQAH